MALVPRTDAAAPPVSVLLVAVLTATFLITPVVALFAQVSPAELLPQLTSESALAALRVSLLTAIPATALVVVLGVPLGIFLARRPGFRLLRVAVLLPLVLPPVVSGIALISVFGRMGVVGKYLHAWGIEVAFSAVAVILAQSFVALPFLVLAVESAVHATGNKFEGVAATLGASSSFTLWHVTLPLARPAIITGGILAFARALGEFGATITFAGSLQGATRTLPLEIYLQREVDPAGAVALSSLLVVVAVVIIAVTYARGART